MRRVSTIAITAIFSSALLLSGCATTYDPAEVCTANWIKPRASKAVSELRSDMGSSIKKLVRSAEKLKSGGKLSPWAMASMLNTAQGMVTKVERSKGLKDLRILSENCNDPAIMKDAFTGFLDDMGVSDQLRVMFEQMQALKFPEKARDAMKDLPGGI